MQFNALQYVNGLINHSWAFMTKQRNMPERRQDVSISARPCHATNRRMTHLLSFETFPGPSVTSVLKPRWSFLSFATCCVNQLCHSHPHAHAVEVNVVQILSVQSLFHSCLVTYIHRGTDKYTCIKIHFFFPQQFLRYIDYNAAVYHTELTHFFTPNLWCS